MVAARLAEVYQRIAHASQRARRDPREIVLIAITKGCSQEAVGEACAAGVRVVGENRVQEAEAKFPPVQRPSLAGRYPGFSLHLVGHLQTNKARRAVHLFDVIQSLDSLRLGDCLEREAAALGKTLDCLIQVKLNEDLRQSSTRSGAPPELLPGLLAASTRWPHLRMCGVMAIAPVVEDPETARPWFRSVKALFDKTRQEARFSQSMRWLSLGMSHDFEVAIEEGANMVRIGTAIFGPRS